MIHMNTERLGRRIFVRSKKIMALAKSISYIQIAGIAESATRSLKDACAPLIFYYYFHSFTLLLTVPCRPLSSLQIIIYYIITRVLRQNDGQLHQQQQ